MKVKILKLNELAKTPLKAHGSDFCYDLFATSVEEKENGVLCYGTGIALQMDRGNLHHPFNNEELCNISFDVRPRSSIWKTGLVLCNSTGTIDQDYTGEIKCMFYKVGKGEPYKIGDRIGQIKVGFTTPIDFVDVDSLEETDRGAGGFGSTGK